MYRLKTNSRGRLRRMLPWLLPPMALLLCLGLALLAYQIPFVNQRLSWRITVLQAEIKYALSPPEQVVFTPNPSQGIMPAKASPTPTPQATALPNPTAQAPPTATISPMPTATPSATPTSLPERVMLPGVRHEYQKYNNCGPANLSMALSFWGWEGDQRDTAAYLKPLAEDKNVMPYEMETYVETQTNLQATVRVGGDLDLIKGLVAAGYPTILEMGFEPPDKDWMGHYELVTGYDESKQRLYVQDTYIMSDFPLPYDEVLTYWQHFNYIFIVLYPPEQEGYVMQLLGEHADERRNYEYATRLASEEIARASGRDLYFAWFNRGTNLMRLQDYAGAAQAYDQAFAIYATLEPETRPWRMLWYQTGPYFAYYYSGRYYDVLNLTTSILNNMDKPIHEESYYWRGLAKEALDDRDGAIADYRASLAYHPGFEPSVYALERLGETP